MAVDRQSLSAYQEAQQRASLTGDCHARRHLQQYDAPPERIA
jgi:hypothetical protein